MENQERIRDSERWASALLGGMLILSSLRRLDVKAGTLFTVGGAALVYRGLTGHDGLFERAGDFIRDALAEGRRNDAVVDEASMESFPASDAPSWTPVSSVGGDEEDE